VRNDQGGWRRPHGDGTRRRTNSEWISRDACGARTWGARPPGRRRRARTRAEAGASALHSGENADLGEEWTGPGLRQLRKDSREPDQATAEGGDGRETGSGAVGHRHQAQRPLAGGARALAVWADSRCLLLRGRGAGTPARHGVILQAVATQRSNTIAPPIRSTFGHRHRKKGRNEAFALQASTGLCVDCLWPGRCLNLTSPRNALPLWCCFLPTPPPGKWMPRT